MSDKKTKSKDVELSDSFGTITKLSKVEFVNALSTFSSEEDDSEEQIFEVHASGSY
jgi:hypothetical protein